MKFSEMNLKPEILKAIKRSGFEEATPIQEKTIPLVLEGKDVIGQAQTGTGKTAAFGLPILQNLDKQHDSIQAIVIEPTRELAIQTQEELFRLGRDEKARVQVVYGGADIRRQIRALKQTPAILVGTPGRLLDHLKRGTIDISKVKTIVLDEADEMLDMGFIQDIESILNYASSKHQTLLFSATMPKPILRIGEKFMHDPEIVKIKGKELTANLIDQYFVRAKENEKFDILCRLIDVQNPDLAVIFGRTKRRVDELTRGLQARGYNAAGIHGDLSKYTAEASQLLDDYSAVDLVAALLKNLSKDAESVKVKITPEKPLPFKSKHGNNNHHFKRNFKRGGDRNERYHRKPNARRGGRKHDFVIKKKD
ncbi:DEAD/DEAH box helicase [Lactobacillus paragasseri]|uniref:DEAD/DEAH box helicase n=1 Tax=Lactobacillus paragasseri TaxID=2107999 RepID=UPI003FA59B81